MALLLRASLFTALSLIPLLSTASAEEILVGWNDFSTGFQLYRFSETPKSADQALPNVQGSLWGGNGSRETWGSNDGTYGPTESVGSTTANGAMSLRTNQPVFFFSLSNNGNTSLSLSQILFDFASVNNNSPRNLELFYDSGDLDIADGTSIAAWTSIHNNLGIISDYEDVTVNLSSLSDHNLAPEESATFRFVPDTASNSFQAMLIDNVAITGETFDELRVLTYNIHGGKGPNDAGTVTGNLTAFRDNFLRGEDVLCLQEVDLDDVWDTVQTVFSDYPFRYQTINTTTRYSGFLSFLNKQTSVAILSKYPFVSTHNQLVNTDPSIDRWERHGQHVQIEIGGEVVHIFNYHNTFDPEDGGTSSEVAGMVKFRDYITDRLGANALSQQGRVLALGDFNINGSLVDNIMPNLISRATDWVDHVTGMSYFSASGFYPTLANQISDHDAVWASLDLQGPTPSPATWLNLPIEAGTTSITMTASPAADPNGVSYYFTNTDFPDGSHDSGWQNSATYTDTGLSPATQYSYTFQTRDQSANENQSAASVSATTWTDDGDSLPNDWEFTHFSSLTATSGSPSEDSDNDGWSDFNEWIAGTDPTDRASLLTLTVDHGNNADLELRWNSVAGKNYRVWRSRTLNGDWLLEGGEVSAQVPENSYPIDLNNEDSMFFRIEVLP